MFPCSEVNPEKTSINGGTKDALFSVVCTLWMDSSLPKEGALTKAFTAIAHTGGPYLDSLVSKVERNTSPFFSTAEAQLAFLLTYSFLQFFKNQVSPRALPLC